MRVFDIFLNLKIKNTFKVKHSGLKQLIKEEIQKVLNEGKLSPKQQERLNSLRDELSSATAPDRDDYDSYEGREPEEIRADIRLEFGDKIADQIEDGEYEMHFPRDKGVPGNFQANDKLQDKVRWGYSNPRMTKSGKMNKQDVNKMKNYYKRGY